MDNEAEFITRSKEIDDTRWRGRVQALSREFHIVTPEAANREANAPWSTAWAHGLTPADLVAPWTPELILLLCRVDSIVEHYKHYDELGRNNHLLHAAWFPDLYEDNAMTHGEQMFAVILDTLRATGLGQDTIRHNRYGDTTRWNWIEWVEARRERFRKRVKWLRLRAHTRWTLFQVDINSPSLFLDVTGPDVWQVIVDAFRDDESFRYRDMWSFLQNMQMASLDYIQKELPGPHLDETRVHDSGMPLGYGTSLNMPSFGYRREHRSEQRLAGWAAAHGMDLFNPQIW